MLPTQPLSREFFYHKAGELLPLEERQQLRKSGAEVLLAQGNPALGAELLKALEDWQGLTHILLQYGPTFGEHGRTQALENWLSSVDPEIVGLNPWPLYWLGI